MYLAADRMIGPREVTSGGLLAYRQMSVNGQDGCVGSGLQMDLAYASISNSVTGNAGVRRRVVNEICLEYTSGISGDRRREYHSQSWCCLERTSYHCLRSERRLLCAII